MVDLLQNEWLVYMRPIYEKESINKKKTSTSVLLGAGGYCCEAAARARVHRDCTVGVVGDGLADTAEEAEWENVMLSPPHLGGGGIAEEAKVRVRGR